MMLFPPWNRDEFPVEYGSEHTLPLPFTESHSFNDTAPAFFFDGASSEFAMKSTGNKIDSYNKWDMQTIVILAHGWNNSWASFHGNEWVRTPNLDRIAAESVVFDRHFASTPHPKYWHHSFYSGKRITHSQIAAPGSCHASMNHLLNLFRQSGTKLFRIIERPSHHSSDGSVWSQNIEIHEQPGIDLGQETLTQLCSLVEILKQSENWVLWLESNRLVPPWAVSLDHFDEYTADLIHQKGEEELIPMDEPVLGPTCFGIHQKEILAASYAAVLTEWDKELENWLQLFHKHGFDRTALWIVSSGHGIALGEHQFVGCDAEVPYSEFCQLPLLVRYPNALHAGRRVTHLTADIDIIPSLLDYYSLVPNTAIERRSFLPLLAGPSQPIHDSLLSVLVNEKDLTLSWTLRDSDWTSICTPVATHHLFRQPEDRWEANDVRLHNLELAERMETYANSLCHHDVK